MGDDVVMGVKGAAKSASMIGVGQNRAANTIKLRKQYDSYVSNRQSDGLDFLPFAEWAEKTHPEKKIIK